MSESCPVQEWVHRVLVSHPVLVHLALAHQESVHLALACCPEQVLEHQESVSRPVQAQAKELTVADQSIGLVHAKL